MECVSYQVNTFEIIDWKCDHLLTYNLTRRYDQKDDQVKLHHLRKTGSWLEGRGVFFHSGRENRLVLRQKIQRLEFSLVMASFVLHSTI